MKKCIYLLLLVITICLISCSTSNQPSDSSTIPPDIHDTVYIPDSSLHKGTIIGTIYWTAPTQGYYIITNNGDSILSFSKDLAIGKDYPYATYYGEPGAYKICDYSIPYLFTYTLLDSLDNEYYPLGLIVNLAVYPPFTHPQENFQQAIVKRIK